MKYINKAWFQLILKDDRERQGRYTDRLTDKQTGRQKNRWIDSRDGFSYFRSGVGWITIWGGAAACFGRGVVATPGKAKEKV